MKKSKKEKVDRASIISGIKDRLKGSSTGGLFVSIPDNSRIEVRLLGKCMEARVHMFSGADSSFHRFVCEKRWLVGDKPKFKKSEDRCPICKHIEKLLEEGKNKKADRMKAQSVFVWNAINKTDPNNSDGELDTKIFEHKWQVFEGIGEILEDRDDAFDEEDGIGIIVKKIVKGGGKKKNTKYKAKEGSAWPLSDEEKALELKDLWKFYKFPDDPQKLSSALGIDIEEFSEKDSDEGDDEDDEDSEEDLPKKKKHHKQEDDDEDDEDSDSDDDEDSDEEVKPKKKAKKQDDDEDDEDEDEDDEDLSDDDDEDEDKPKKKKHKKHDDDDDDEDEDDE